MRKTTLRISMLSTSMLMLIISTRPALLYASPFDEKMKPEDLVAKHLQSLGPAEALNPARSRIMTGTAQVVFKAGGRGQLAGSAKLASQRDKSLISMTFGALDYPYEKLGFDGKRLTASQVKPGVRTVIGRYFLTNEALFREGLFGGALSTAWPLVDLSRKNLKLQYQGLKKIDNRPVHQLKCSARNSDVRVNLLFDPTTFQHVGTQYQQILDPTVAANRPGESMHQEETRINITESFSEFGPEGGLNLPHLYQVKLEIIGPSGSMLYEWSIALKQFMFGEPISPDDFIVDVDRKS